MSYHVKLVFMDIRWTHEFREQTLHSDEHVLLNVH